MKVIVGLGNPGREYAATRHNVGWWLIDHLADVWHFDGWKKDDNSHVANGTVGGVKVRLVKPQTYMNLSGQALKNFVRRPFWSPAKDLLIVLDEVQLPVGRIRIRPRGSAGGHNGLKSIEHALDTHEYGRLRIARIPGTRRSRKRSRIRGCASPAWPVSSSITSCRRCAVTSRPGSRTSAASSRACRAARV